MRTGLRTSTMTALLGIVSLAACSDDIHTPPDAAYRVPAPQFFQQASPGIIVEELWLSDELEDLDSQLALEWNGSKLYYVALDEVTKRANLTLRADLSVPACADGQPLGVDCQVAFDKIHISARPDGKRIYAINRNRPNRPSPSTDQSIYTGTPIGYYDVDADKFVWMGMIPGLPVAGTVLAANSGNGDFYVANAQSDKLYRINVGTLEITDQWPIVRNTGGTLDVQGSDIAFDALGTLYIWTNADVDRGLWSVQIVNLQAVATRVGGTSSSEFTGLAFRQAGNGPLLGSTATPDSRIYEISPSNGAVGQAYEMYRSNVRYHHLYGDMTTGRLALAQPAIQLVKKTNGTDNNSITGPLVAVGSTVTWSYEVTNTGNVSLTNVVVRDDNGTPSNLLDDFTVCTIASMAPGASQTCTATGIATVGQFKNWGVVTGLYNGVTVTDDDPDHYFGQAVALGAAFIIIDEDGIDNGPRYWLNSATTFTSSNIKTWTTNDVNDDRPHLAQRLQLRWFAANVGKTYWFFTGQVGDEGWFAPKFIPSSWASAGPGTDGLRNFLGDPTKASATPRHLVGPGLGTGSDPEKLLDKVPHVIPLRAEGLWGLKGRTVCALVWDSDISINYDQSKPDLGINGSLKGEKLGVVAFDVLEVVYLGGWSSSTLPRVQVTIRDANEVCNGKLELYRDAPEPKSSSVPADIRPNHTGDNNGYAFITR
jgi:hypothetical protein